MSYGVGAFALLVVAFTLMAVDIYECCLGRPGWWKK